MGTFMQKQQCQNLGELLKLQRDFIEKHIEEHQYLRKIFDKNEAISSFVHDYSWIFREIFCSKICPFGKECDMSGKMLRVGDLIRDRETPQ